MPPDCSAWTPLAGRGELRWLARFGSWPEALAARDLSRERSRVAADAPSAPYWLVPDPVQQYLLASGRTSFGGMRFGELRRLALDIEVVTGDGHEFPSAQRAADRIVAVALADSTGFRHVVRGDRLDEAALLAETTRIIGERDPDVIEGHNIFRFDLEYIEARARRHAHAPALGTRRQRPAGPAGAALRRRAHHRLSPLRDRGPPRGGHLDAGPAARRGRPRSALVRPQGHRAPPGRGRRRPDVRGSLDDRAAAGGVARSAHGLRGGRRAGDARRGRHPGAALLHPGPAPAVRLSVRHAAWRGRQDRLAAGSRISAVGPRRAVARRLPIGRRRTRRHLATGRGRAGAARGRHLALSLADAGPRHRAGFRRAGRYSRRCSITCATFASGPSTWPAAPRIPRSARTSTRCSRRSRSSSMRSTATWPSPAATSTTSPPPIA